MDIDVADADTDSVTNALRALIKEHMDEDESELEIWKWTWNFEIWNIKTKTKQKTM